MTMFNTLLLSPAKWDLLVGGDGNIAMASPPYAVAQDVASAIKTFCKTSFFAGDVWYDTSLGVPYFDATLGHRPPMSLVRKQTTNQALTVPGVVSARAVITQFADRRVRGQCLIIDELGAQNDVSF